MRWATRTPLGVIITMGFVLVIASILIVSLLWPQTREVVSSQTPQPTRRAEAIASILDAARSDFQSVKGPQDKSYKATFATTALMPGAKGCRIEAATDPRYQSKYVCRMADGQPWAQALSIYNELNADIERVVANDWPRRDLSEGELRRSRSFGFGNTRYSEVLVQLHDSPPLKDVSQLFAERPVSGRDQSVWYVEFSVLAALAGYEKSPRVADLAAALRMFISESERAFAGILGKADEPGGESFQSTLWIKGASDCRIRIPHERSTAPYVGCEMAMLRDRDAVIAAQENFANEVRRALPPGWTLTAAAADKPEAMVFREMEGGPSGSTDRLALQIYRNRLRFYELLFEVRSRRK